MWMIKDNEWMWVTPEKFVSKDDAKIREFSLMAEEAAVEWKIPLNLRENFGMYEQVADISAIMKLAKTYNKTLCDKA